MSCYLWVNLFFFKIIKQTYSITLIVNIISGWLHLSTVHQVFLYRKWITPLTYIWQHKDVNQGKNLF